MVQMRIRIRMGYFLFITLMLVFSYFYCGNKKLNEEFLDFLFNIHILKSFWD